MEPSDHEHRDQDQNTILMVLLPPLGWLFSWTVELFEDMIHM